MERGRNNKTKSSFKMKKTPVKFVRGRGRVTRDPNIYNPGRPATPTGGPQEFSPEQMEALQDLLQDMRENVTQVNPKPQPQDEVGQLSQPQQHFNEITGKDNFPTISQAAEQIMPNRKPAPDTSRYGMPLFTNLGYLQDTSGSNLGRTTFNPSGFNPLPPGVYERGIAKRSALSFKRKPSGFKMKKK